MNMYDFKQKIESMKQRRELLHSKYIKLISNPFIQRQEVQETYDEMLMIDIELHKLLRELKKSA